MQVQWAHSGFPSRHAGGTHGPTRSGGAGGSLAIAGRARVEEHIVRVLVATDGSDDAVDAAARGVRLLGAADHVTVVSVVHTPTVVSSGMESGFAGGMATPEIVDAAWDAAKEEADRNIDRTVAALPEGPAVERRIETGEPGLAIVAAAEELGADAVVIGSRGRGAIRRALLGSVSAHVVRHAPCAVLVVGRND